MTFAVVIVLLVIGTLLFHFLSPWWFTPIASNWSTMDQTVSITFWVTGVVFVAVNLFVAYAVIRYRHREGQRADYEPENRKLEWSLTLLTTVGVAAMLAPGLVVWARFVEVPKDAAVVEVLGQQWHWAYRFPGGDGRLGATDPRLMTTENPFGMSAEDPAGRDDVLVYSPALHLPVGKPVKLLLRSKDVLHNYTVPQFRVKMDMVPGMVTYLWFTPTRTGEFDVLCEELCGIAHYAMRGRVAVDTQHDFDAWLARYPTFGATRTMAAADPAAGKALYAPCVACHGESGQGNPQLNAPRLAAQDEWYVRRQLENFKAGLRGKHAQDVYGAQMLPFASLLADDAAIRDVAAYIASLPDEAPRSTVAGNAARGATLYQTCAACHGDAGQGIAATNAPRLAHMSDWYLARQLANFKAGVRGADRHDLHGQQMAMMSAVLRDPRAVDDVLAHINTLRPATQRVAMTQ